MVIIEGPDGSGKSTLIKHLGLDPLWMGGVRVRTPEGVRSVDPQLSVPEQLYGQIENWLGKPIAFDRFHLSEHVYGPLLRGQEEVTLDHLDVLGGVLRKHSVPVILCLPPLNVAYDNVVREGRPRPAYQTDEFLRRAYDRFSFLQPWATIVYDFTRDPIPELVSHVH